MQSGLGRVSSSVLQPHPRTCSARRSSTAANAAVGRHAHTATPAYDLILSSGFLAFASHSGFLSAIEEANMKVQGVMGTSAGALAGSLYCAGYTPREVAAQLSRQPPIALLRPSLQPWRGGVLSLDGVVERLRDLLPPTFEDLQTEFAVGVVSAETGQHLLIDSGPLPEAVAASAAIPWLFQAVDIPGYSRINLLSPYKDGGCVDRVGLRSWRERRHRQALARGDAKPHVPPAIAHVISRSSPLSGLDDVVSDPAEKTFVLKSPQSGVNLFSLGEFDSHMDTCQQRVQPALLDIASSLSMSTPSSSSSVNSTAVLAQQPVERRRPSSSQKRVTSSRS